MPRSTSSAAARPTRTPSGSPGRASSPGSSPARSPTASSATEAPARRSPPPGSVVPSGSAPVDDPRQEGADDPERHEHRETDDRDLGGARIVVDAEKHRHGAIRSPIP